MVADRAIIPVAPRAAISNVIPMTTHNIAATTHPVLSAAPMNFTRWSTVSTAPASSVANRAITPAAPRARTFAATPMTAQLTAATTPPAPSARFRTPMPWPPAPTMPAPTPARRASTLAEPRARTFNATPPTIPPIAATMPPAPSARRRAMPRPPASMGSAPGAATPAITVVPRRTTIYAMPTMTLCIVATPLPVPSARLRGPMPWLPVLTTPATTPVRPGITPAAPRAAISAAMPQTTRPIAATMPPAPSARPRAKMPWPPA